MRYLSTYLGKVGFFTLHMSDYVVFNWKSGHVQMADEREMAARNRLGDGEYLGSVGILRCVLLP